MSKHFLAMSLIAAAVAAAPSLAPAAESDRDNRLIAGGAVKQPASGAESAPLMRYSAPAGGLSAGAPSNWLVDPVGADAGRAQSSNVLTLFDETRGSTYFTPRIGGLQIGAAYLGADSPAPAVSGETSSGRYAVGLNYAQQFARFGVAVIAGYAGAERSSLATAGEPDTVSLGAQVSYGGFTLGGSVAENFAADSRLTAAHRSLTTGAYDLGVSYSFGPAAITLSRRLAFGAETLAEPAVEPRERYTLSGRYELGSQINLRAMLAYSGSQGEAEALDPGGWAVLTGLNWSF